MDLFKLTIAPHASSKERETTTSEGPFIVAARDVGCARLLVAFNYSIAALRRLGAAMPAGIWSESGPHQWVKLTGVKEDDLKRQVLVAGTDIAQWYVERPILKDGRKVMARMVWWPCHDGETCPV